MTEPFDKLRAAPKRPLKVFLCHAHADGDAVKALYARLTADGVDAWLDKEKLLPGQDWELEIRKAVREADVVVVCLSKQFNQAGFRQKEVRLALDTAMEKPEGEIFIIPARLDECDTLESLRKWHWVDLFEEDGYERLMRALGARAEKIDATLKINHDARKTREDKDTVRTQIARDEHKKTGREDIEAAEYTKVQREVDKVVKNAKQQLERKLFFIRLQNMFNKFFLYFRYYIFPAILLIAVVVATFYMAKPYFDDGLPSAPTAANEQPVSPQPSLLIIETDTSNPEAFETVTPTLSPTELIDAKDVSMVFVPAGEFIMGSTKESALAECKKFRNGSGNDCQPGWFTNEEPPHSIYLNSYWIDRTEVTNEMYAECVASGVCQPPRHSDPQYYPQDYYEVYYENPIYANYPVVNISWNDAQKFCSWRDGRLPTESEWEKAARGVDGRLYPWGDGIDCSYANHQTKDGVCMLGEYIRIAPVGNYPKGASPYGVFDMAGNVAEWVADWYSDNYYGQSPTVNPLGPPSGDFHVIRGGSWSQDAPFLRTTVRTVYSSLDEPSDEVGFRCARDAHP